jgi:5-(carboxyamino)imidazole ribonucleotide mutase
MVRAWALPFRLLRPSLTAYSFMPMANALVGIIMGSTSDWETIQHAARTLEALGIPYEKRVISAHRTPQLMYEWSASARDRGLKVVIAAAGGAAHLAGVAAALTPLPVLGVPMESAALKGLDSLLSMVQMPGGIPVATFAIGKPGAVNAALFAAAILALNDAVVKKALDDFRAAQAKKVEETKLP